MVGGGETDTDDRVAEDFGDVAKNEAADACGSRLDWGRSPVAATAAMEVGESDDATCTASVGAGEPEPNGDVCVAPPAPTVSEDQDASDAKNRSEEVCPVAADEVGESTGVDEEGCKNATAEAVARGENTKEESAEAVVTVVAVDDGFEPLGDANKTPESREEAAAEGGGDRPIKESDASLAGLGVLMRYDWLTLGLAGLVVKECVEGDFVKNKS
jgi:hypothetical protein